MTQNDSPAAGAAARERGAEKAAVVLAAARQLFLEHGFAAATTDMIQKAAGVSKSTVYAHYPGKEALFSAVIAAECNGHMSRIRATADAGRGRGLRQVLEAISLAYLEIVLSDSGVALFRTAVGESARFPDLMQQFYAAGPRSFHQILRDVLAEADAAGEVRIGPAGLSIAASSFASLLRGDWQMAQLLSPGERPGRAQLEGWVETVVELFLRAHAAR